MANSEVLAALQARLAIQFRNESWLARALLHRSASLDARQDSNERLEFLGDSIVGMVICDDLLSRFPEASEGELAKAKAFLASEPILATASRALGIDAAVELSAAEEASGGRNRRSILADAFEAVVAAVYLDQGMRSAKRLVRRALKEATHRVATSEYSHDYKSRLQELLQATDRRTPHYRISATSGAHHDRTFTAEALSGRKVIGAGVGKSKKEAEQAAARAALETPDGSNRRGSGAHGPGGSDG